MEDANISVQKVTLSTDINISAPPLEILDTLLLFCFQLSHFINFTFYLVPSIPLCWWLLLVSMAVKHNNVLLNLITGCLYWLTTSFGQLHDQDQVYKS